MRIASPAFADKAPIPKKYTCDGENISPPLDFWDVPPTAKSLALIMDDPDVPKHLKPDGMFDHWVVFNIPPMEATVPEGRNPSGVLGNNTSGKAAYTGPCPPDRQHRYFFKLYALDSMLDLAAGATKQTVEHAMQRHILAQAELVGLYERA